MSCTQSPPGIHKHATALVADGVGEPLQLANCYPAHAPPWCTQDKKKNPEGCTAGEFGKPLQLVVKKEWHMHSGRAQLVCMGRFGCPIITQGGDPPEPGMRVCTADCHGQPSKAAQNPGDYQQE